MADQNSKTITLRVGTYNIKNGSDVNHEMSVLADDIKSFDLDIVGLQEVDVCTKRANNLDSLKILADEAGYPYYCFAKAIDFMGGQYGTAIMSRYPIISFEVIKLGVKKAMEGRSLGHALIDVGAMKVNFFNTHLSFEDRSVRTGQFEYIAELLKGVKGFILTADFNTHIISEFDVISSSKLVNAGKYVSFPRSNKAIDDIVLDERWNIISSGASSDLKHSDHNLIWAKISCDVMI